ncbi:MAG: acyloxyacyl hydrolase [Chromatiales bacterium]
MRILLMCTAALAGLLLWHDPVRAVDGIAVEIGVGDEDSARGGAAAQWDWRRNLFSAGDWYLSGFWELSLSYWDGDNGSTGNGSLGEAGFTPVFRMQPRTAVSGVVPYLEAAIGLHVMTATELGDRDFDIPFAFGDHVGAGLRFGPQGGFDLGYRFQHLSNASIGDSNPGINFHLFRLGNHF